MRRLGNKIGLLLVFVIYTTPAVADDMADAEAAYRDGRYETAFELFKPLADRGIVAAEVRLAELYGGKDGVKPDYSKAFALYEQLARQGVAAGERGLGISYYGGFGVAKDVGQAARWFSLAAAHSDPFAQMFLGTMYLKGNGVPVNRPQGIKWIRTAADDDDTMAQYLVGTFYEHGVGVSPDLVQALKWYLISEERKYGWEDEYAVALAEHRIMILSMIMPAQAVAKANALAKDWKPHSADGTL